MKPRIVFLVILSIAAMLFFAYVLRQLSFVSVGMAANAEAQSILRESLEDQKKLARYERERAAAYRGRFEDIRTLLHRLEILALTRRDLTRQFERVLLAIVGMIVGGGAIIYILEHRGRERRLARLGGALEALSRGDADIVVFDRRRDVIGRIGRMIEATSQIMARERRRVQYLEHLSAWQEAARRHAHEIRTPLTAAQLEVDRLVRTIEKRLPEAAPELQQAKASIFEELDQLRRFTKDFVSFAQVGKPQLRRHDVAMLLDEFRETFAPNWPDLAFSSGGPLPSAAYALLDRDQIRQVLVNLCNNSALAGAQAIALAVRRNGANVLVDVADDGPGIAPAVRGRIFEPYVTTRSIGEGMGLGLAISKKILLDHGGDLDLIPSDRGATFRLTLPEAPA